MSGETTNKVMGKINEIKSNIETFIADVNVNDLKASFNLLMKDAQKDFNKLVDKDLAAVKKKLNKEKADFELKAKKFLDSHKKELNSLQSRIEKLIETTSKLKKKGPTVAKAVPTRKKVIKKVAKVNAKPGFKKAPVRKPSTKQAL